METSSREARARAGRREEEPFRRQQEDRPTEQQERQEQERLAALHRYDVLAGAPPEECFDRLTRLAAHLTGAPGAQIRFVGAGRQWAASTYGGDCEDAEGARAKSCCARVIETPGVEVVEDARQDERCAGGGPAAESPSVRFCAAAPLQTPSGARIGALCVFGPEPRSLSEDRQQALRDLAATVVDQLERERALVRAREAEAAQRASEEKYARLFETANDAILIFEPENEIVLKANAKAAEMYGLERSELVGRSLRAFTEDVERGEQVLDRALQAGSFQDLETRHRRSDGTLIDVLINATVISFEGREALLSIHRDVTERKRAQERTRELKSFYENILDEVPVEIAVLDPEGRYRYMNRAAMPDPEMRRWIIGKTDMDYARRRGRDDREQYRERREWLLEVVEQKETDRRLEKMPASDGGTEYLMRYLVPVTGADGAVEYVIGHTVDLTERKRNENALREAKERAEEAAQVKDAILNNISHEVRTPLASMMGFADVLAEDLEDKYEESAEFARIIRTSGERLQETLESVLLLARLEADRLDLESSFVDVRAQARRAAERYRSQARAKELALHAPGAPADADALRARTDATALDRVLGSLLANAVKFTDEGSITVEAGRLPPGASPPGRKMAGSGEAETAHVFVAVRDTGPGISGDFLPRLFEDFEQESSGLGRQYQGAGLGLSITRRLVERMDGAVYVDSCQGGGTTVTVCLPPAGA